MRIKYMGTSDIRRLTADETLGDRLADPLGTDVEWSKGNSWIIDTDDYSDVSSDFWTALLEAFPEEWKDVSGFKRVPVNAHQSMFLGMTSIKTDEELAAEDAARREQIAQQAEAEQVRANNAYALANPNAVEKSELLDIAAQVGADVKEGWSRERIADTINAKLSETEGQAVQTSPLGSTPAPVSPGGSTAGNP